MTGSPGLVDRTPRAQREVREPDPQLSMRGDAEHGQHLCGESRSHVRPPLGMAAQFGIDRTLYGDAKSPRRSVSQPIQPRLSAAHLAGRDAVLAGEPAIRKWVPDTVIY
jgi:hypothetical protein